MRDLTVIQGGGAPDDRRGEWESDLDEAASGFQGRASTSGHEFKHTVADFLIGLGAQVDTRSRKVSSYKIDLEITGSNGDRFGILAHGTFDDDVRSGLRRTDTVKKMGFDARQIKLRLPDLKLLAIVSHLPSPGTAGEAQLADTAVDLFDVIAINDDVRGIDRLRHYLNDRPFPDHRDAPWRHHAEPFTPNLFDAIDNHEES